jgi:hypothetical protein
MSTTAICGHGHYDSGHCGQPDCPNDFRRCTDPGCTMTPAPSCTTWDAPLRRGEDGHVV